MEKSENPFALFFHPSNVFAENTALLVAKKSKKNVSEDEQEPAPAAVTSIKIDKKNQNKQNRFFSGIDESLVKAVENGAPESIEKVYAKLRKPSVDYQENEKVLLKIANQIMKLVWPSVKIDWEAPVLTEKNAYSGALDSVAAGIYDTSTGNADFLSTVIPSLVLCTSYSRTDYYEQAEKDLKAALDLVPDSVVANYLMGILYAKMSRNEDALPYLKKVSTLTSVFEASYSYAECLFNLNMTDESALAADQLIVRFPSNPQLLKLCARTAFASGDYASAERFASLVLQQNPSNLEFVLFRARIFVQTGEYLKAASLLDVYSKNNATSKEYLILRATIQKKWNKNLNSSMATIESALKIYPGDTEVMLLAAEIASETGAPINGLSGGQLAESVLENDPGNRKALSFLVRYLVKQQEWKGAYEASSKVMGMPDADIDDMCTHVKICIENRILDEAWRVALAVYEKTPEEEKAIQIYIQAMVATGRLSQALKMINTMLPSASSGMKSFLYYQKSFIDSVEAVQLSDLRSSLIANPRNSDALMRMYGFYFSKKDYRKAQYYLRQVVSLNPNDSYFLKLSNELDQLLK